MGVDVGGGGVGVAGPVEEAGDGEGGLELGEEGGLGDEHLTVGRG